MDTQTTNPRGTPTGRTQPLASTIQFNKLIELETALRGDGARARLDARFQSEYHCDMERATYEQAARITGTLLAELRNRKPEQADAPPESAGPWSPISRPPEAAEKSGLHTVPHDQAAQTPLPSASTASVVPLFHEAPYSVNFFAVSPAGFRKQFTIRAATEDGIVTRAEHLEARLTSAGYTPVQERAQGATGENEIAPTCVIHSTPMVKRSKDGRSWWACTQKLADGQWCNYRPKSS